MSLNHTQGPARGTWLAMEVTYAIFECVVAAGSTLGNSLIVASFLRNGHLRTPTNTYVFSLAVADLLVSIVGIPIYLYSMITGLPADYLSCLVVNTWIMMLCTVSIFHLVAVSFDRFMAIVLLRQANSRKTRMRQACTSIAIAWICGTVIGFLPLMGWNQGRSDRRQCDFMEIMDLRYLLFLFYFTIITPTLLMAFFYASIFHVVRRQDERMARLRRESESNQRYQRPIGADRGYRSQSESSQWHGIVSDRRIRCQSESDRCSKHKLESINGHRDVRESNPCPPNPRPLRCSKEWTVSGTETSESTDLHQPGLSPFRRSALAIKVSMKKKSMKSTRIIRSFLLVIIAFFTSWYPLYTLNAITYYAPDYRIDQSIFYVCIVLSHVSSAINPLIYARTMPGFKEALMETLLCEKSGTRRQRQSSLSLLNQGANLRH